MYTQAGGKLQEHTRVCILRLVENNRNTHEDVYTQTGLEGESRQCLWTDYWHFHQHFNILSVTAYCFWIEGKEISFKESALEVPGYVEFYYIFSLHTCPLRNSQKQERGFPVRLTQKTTRKLLLRPATPGQPPDAKTQLCTKSLTHD